MGLGLANQPPQRAQHHAGEAHLGRGRLRIGVRVRVRVSGSVGLAPHFRMREELPCLVQRYGRGVIRHLVRAMTRVGDGIRVRVRVKCRGWTVKVGVGVGLRLRLSVRDV